MRYFWGCIFFYFFTQFFLPNMSWLSYPLRHRREATVTMHNRFLQCQIVLQLQLLLRKWVFCPVSDVISGSWTMPCYGAWRRGFWLTSPAGRPGRPWSTTGCPLWARAEPWSCARSWSTVCWARYTAWGEASAGQADPTRRLLGRVFSGAAWSLFLESLRKDPNSPAMQRASSSWQNELFREKYSSRNNVM